MGSRTTGRGGDREETREEIQAKGRRKTAKQTTTEKGDAKEATQVEASSLEVIPALGARPLPLVLLNRLWRSA